MPAPKDPEKYDIWISNLSKSHIGQISWCKGLTKETDVRIKVAGENISKSLKGHIPWDKGIKRPEVSGENHWNFKNWVSREPYCHKFNKDLKESVRFRDNYICQLCGKTQVENKEKLSVHHIHYDKQNCYPDLITLCRQCNAKVNQERKYYENKFMNNLNERQLLFWTKRRENVSFK